MASTTFTAGTVIASSWLNDVNDLTYEVAQSGTGAVNRTAVSKLLDKVNLLDFGAVYDGATDASTALTNALAAATEVEITGQILLSSQVLIPTNKRITMLGLGGILVNMSTFTGGKTSATGCALVFNGVTGSQQSIRGGYIRPNTYTDSRACIAIRVLSSVNVLIENVNFNNWSAADGIVNVDSSRNVTITNCRFRDGTTATGQIAGIMCDDNTVGGIGSRGLKIIGNDFYNLRGLNAGAVNESSDGVSIAVLCQSYVIANNTFANVAEPIDTFGSYGSITGNTIINAYNYGIKLVHGASRNSIIGNTINDAGAAGIVLAGTNVANEDLIGNVITGNNIQTIDPSSIWAANDTACIILDDGAAVSTLSLNYISGNILNPGSNGKYCINRAGLTVVGGQNWMPDNFFVQAGTSGYVKDVVLAQAGRITAIDRTNVRAYLNASQNVSTGATSKVLFDAESFDDRNEYEPAGGQCRWTCKIPGVYAFNVQVRLGSITTAGSVITLELRRNGAAAVAVTAHDGRSNLAYLLNTTANCVEDDYFEIFITNGDSATVTAQAGTTLTFFEVSPA